MATDEAAYWSTAQTAAAIATGDVSSVELLDNALARVARFDDYATIQSRYWWK